MSEAAAPKILIVEDEWLIAEYVTVLLQELGCDVVGPASSVREALEILSAARPDAAILDVSLAREKSLPVADELMRREIPFVFSTGYMAENLPEPYSACSIIHKPVSQATLRAGLRPLLEHAQCEPMVEQILS
jgi:CheY-like chemotaxis protein